MTDLDEFHRFCEDAGHYMICGTIERWREMPEPTKKKLRDRWDSEDESPYVTLEKRRMEWE